MLPIKPELQTIIQELEKKIQELVIELSSDSQSPHKSKKQYRSSLNASLDRIFIKDDSFRHIMANPTLAAFYGKDQTDIIGKTDSDLMPEAIASESIASDRQTVNTKSAIITEQQMDGRIYETTRFPLPLPNGKTGVGGIIRDITKHKREEEKLRISEKKYRSILENIEDGYFEADLTGTFTFCNGALCKIYGYPPGELIGRNNRQSSDKKNAKKVFEAFNKIYKTEIPGKVFDYEIICRDGTIKQLEVAASLKKDATGNTIGFQGIIRDITERVKAGEQLRESEEKYRLVVENCSEAICIAQDGRLKFVNKAACDLMGTSKELLTAKPFVEFIHPADRDTVFSFHLRRLAGEDVPNSYIFRIVTPGEIVKWAEVHTVLISWQGRPATLTFLSDITTRLQAEKALRESEERWQFALEGSGDGIWDWNAESDKVFFSRRWKEMIGYGENEIGDNLAEWSSRVHPDDLEQCFINLKKHFNRTTPYYQNEHRLRCKDGTYKWILDRGKIIEWKNDGTPLRVIGTHTDITEQKKAAEKLYKSEQQHRIITENIQDNLWLTDMNFYPTWVSPSVMKSRGFTLEELKQIPWHKQMTANSFHLTQRLIRENLTPGNLADKNKTISVTCELEIYRKDGSTFWTDLTVTLLRNERGEPIGFVGLSRDISERKKVEARQKLINDILSILNAPGEITSMIKSILHLIKRHTGFEAVGLRLQSDEDYPYYETEGFSDFFILHAGSLCARNEKNEIIRDANGEPFLRCMCGNVIRGRTNEKQQCFTTAGTFWTNNLSGFLQSTSDHDRLDAEMKTCSFAGYESIALIPLRSGTEINGLLQLTDKQPNVFSPDLIEFYENVATSIAVAVKRLNAEKALRESEYKLRILFEQAAVGVAQLESGTGKFIRVNQYLCEILGYSQEEMLSRLFDSITHPDDIEKNVRKIKLLNNGEIDEFSLEERLIHKNGSVVWVNIIVKSMQLADSKTGFQIVIVQNITERKKMETHAVQAQKMEAIGTLAGGIAHDFNNILGTIIGYAGMAREELPEDSPTQECIDQIFKASDRAKFLVQQILTFSRRTEVDKKPLIIVPIIKEVVKFLRHALPATINIRQDINAKDEMVLADPTQIHQILMNLCMNAGHAMREEGGNLTIILNQIKIHKNKTPGYESLNAGSYLELKITDTGHGIDPAIRNQIFDPFFTTKKKGEGTGMGLAVVHGIVKSYGGHITVESTKGVGTTFTVYLPAIHQQITPPEDSVHKPIIGGKEKILVIDDQDSMLQIMEIMLSRLGYGVTAKQNSLDALTLFYENPFAFDMIITDQTMPDLTGSNLAKKVLRIRPDIPIILCTGFSDLISADQAREMGIREYLMKPVTISDLAYTVRNIFEGKEGYGKNSGDR